MNQFRGEFALITLIAFVVLIAGGLNGFNLLAVFGHDMQDYRFVQVLYVSYAFSVAGISALVAAIVLDRWAPNLLLPVGVIILAAGMAVFGYVSGMPGLIYAAIPVGVGAVVIGPLILFPVFAKGCTQFRGTAIGLVALLGSIAVMPAATGVITDRLSPEVAGLAVASVLVLLALILLKFLPIFYPPRSVVGAAHKWRRRAVEEAAADIITLVRAAELLDICGAGWSGNGAQPWYGGISKYCVQCNRQ